MYVCVCVRNTFFQILNLSDSANCLYPKRKRKKGNKVKRKRKEI